MSIAAEFEPASTGHGPAFALQAALTCVVGFLMAVIWAAAGGGYFWPVWVWLPLGVALSVHAGLRWALDLRTRQARSFAVVGVLAGIVNGMLVTIWALAGAGYFWPIWPLLALASVCGVLGVVLFRDRLGLGREQELTERVDVLTRTRRGALDAQAAELRRIERDLHDGAQARLVALMMQLGRAEHRLEDQPEVAGLVRAARGEAAAAIAELRDLARGIAPPVLTDRGLAAAVDALGRRAAVPVSVSAELPERPPPVVETAAYFVVAEALANVGKHAPAASARVLVAARPGALVVEVEDDGPGGADPRGTGLTGLRHRAEAVDGTFSVASPVGGGTRIRADLPCAW